MCLLLAVPYNRFDSLQNSNEKKMYADLRTKLCLNISVPGGEKIFCWTK